MYEWLLFAHLLGVAVLLAGLGVHVVSVERLRQAPSVNDLRLLQASAKYGERLVFIGAGLLVTAGLTLAARFWSFTDGWIATSIGLVLAQGVAWSVVGRRMERLRGALDSAPDGVPTADLTVLARDPVLHASNRISVVIIVEILFAAIRSLNLSYRQETRAPSAWFAFPYALAPSGRPAAVAAA